MVTVGASGAFVLSFLAAFDPGDRVVVPEPAFPAYKNILRALGIEVVRLGLGPDTDFKPTVAMLEALAPPIHGLIVASPGNPTGTMLDRAELAEIAAILPGSPHPSRRRRDLPRHHLRADRPARCWSSTSDAIVINGFSKYFCMTGWRLGWLIAPADLVRPIELLAQNLFISPPALAQEAGARGLRLPRRAGPAGRDLSAAVAPPCWSCLPRGGLERFAPVDGAFYLYADVGSSDRGFARPVRRRSSRAPGSPSRRAPISTARTATAISGSPSPASRSG